MVVIWGGTRVEGVAAFVDLPRGSAYSLSVWVHEPQAKALLGFLPMSTTVTPKASLLFLKALSCYSPPLGWGLSRCTDRRW